ncbi:MFS general substrate transporter [Pilatotrama ljubarskyi]|nr:MFS general substrate transporter [Pilatotrama ljubarskyi]
MLLQVEQKSRRSSVDKDVVEVVLEDVSSEPIFPFNLKSLPPPPMTLSAKEEARIWRKIDMRLLPVITVMYLMSFVDRGNIGNAKLQGLITQLNLVENEYNVALTMYFVSYSVCTIPANLLLKKIGPSRWLPGLTLLWGVITTLMGLVKTYPQLVGVRVALGVAEAGLSSGIFYYLTMWYPRYMVHYRIGLFWGGATFAGAFSGLVAYGISFMSGTAGLLGWSWIFVLEGLVTVLVAIAAFVLFVDLPDTAPFLTPEERAYIVYRKKYDNSSGGEEEHFELRHLWEGLLDWQTWASATLNLVNSIMTYGIALFLPSIINGFGFDPTISQLLSVPPYVAATVTVVVWAMWSDRIRRRSPFVFAGYALMLAGFAINISEASIGVKYFGTFLAIVGGFAGFPAIVSWLGNNVVGHYKRGVALGVQLMFGNVGGAIASNIYRIQDAPRYVRGHAIEIGIGAAGLVLVPLTALVYARINARRAARECTEKALEEPHSEEAIRRLGDRAPDFMYTL